MRTQPDGAARVAARPGRRARPLRRALRFRAGRLHRDRCHGVIHDANLGASPPARRRARPAAAARRSTRLVVERGSAGDDGPPRPVPRRCGNASKRSSVCARRPETSLTVQLISSPRISRATSSGITPRSWTSASSGAAKRSAPGPWSNSNAWSRKSRSPGPRARRRIASSPCSATSCARRWRRSCSPSICAHTRQSVPAALRPTLEMIRRNVLLRDAPHRRPARHDPHRPGQDVARARGGRPARGDHRRARPVPGAVAGRVRRDRASRSPRPRITVQADPVRLRQVIWNLLNNAMRNTPAGGRIEIRTDDREPGFVTLVVRDNGRGIDPALLPRIFTFFEQDDDSRRRGTGLGLGLPISKGIVESHGGRISAESGGPGHGRHVHGDVADGRGGAAAHPAVDHRRRRPAIRRSRSSSSRTTRTAPPRSPSSSSCTATW